MGIQNNAARAEQWFNTGFRAHHQGNLEEAARLYRKVLKVYPSHAETLYLLGTALSQTRQFVEAEKCLRKSLKGNPLKPETLNNLGLTLKEQGKAGEAIPLYRKAIELSPDYADAHSNLGGALEYLGNLDEAEPELRLALKLNPALPDAHFILGQVLRGRDKFEEASKCFLRGLELKPDFATAHTDLGVIYKMWGRYDEAISCFERALALDPDSYIANLDIGATFEETGRFDDALAAYDRAIAQNSDDLTARWNKALLYLKQGNLALGWEAYELRFTVWKSYRRFSFPEWDGAPLDGKRVLVYAEQGVGDELYFASCFADLIRIAGHCVIECDPRLEPLIARSFPAATVVGSPRSRIDWTERFSPFDVQVSAGSLPKFMRPTLDSFPTRPGYLVPAPDQVEYWKAKLSGIGSGLKVGICWRSGLTRGERHKEYSQLTQWGNIFSAPGVDFVNLQYGECADELKEAMEKFGIAIHVPEIDLKDELDESAALIRALDLVIAPATATESLAGAVGTETWLISSHQKPWAALGTEGIPGLPNTRVFPQPTAGDWDTLLALIGEALAEKAARNEKPVEYLPLPPGCEIAVNASPDDFFRYVLKEQEGWFNPEYRFIQDLAGTAMVELGCGIGVNAIPAATKGARVFAFTETAAETGLILKSRERNGLENRLTVSIAEPEFSLDEAMDRQGLDGIDLLILSTGYAHPGTLDRAGAFFSFNSPLVMFGVGESATFRNALSASGFSLYRFVPGLQLLAPFAPELLDAFSLNLFACREDRAALLERQGHLVRNPSSLDAFPGIEQPLWQALLANRPYASDHLEAWSQAREKDWEVYWMALNLYALSGSGAAAERFAALQAAVTTLNALVQESATLPRLLSFCRMLSDLGMREAAVHLLNHVCALIETSGGPAATEPFIALDASREQERPGERINEWIVTMALETRERLRAHSTYFTGAESLQVLKRVADSGFASEDAKRRIALIEKGLGNFS
ncbi:MAG: tetratricopeptide repeat protein [Burkholderiales bacterium]|nr:tetratricopeptide repeat protein [Burkholderiales bacterium]